MSPAAASVLPLKDYFGSLAYLFFLLASCIILLPRSTDYFYAMAAIERPTQQATSADRPEPPFLTPITAHPAATAAWCAAGVGITMMWWSGKMARWWGAKESFGQVSDAGRDEGGGCVGGQQRASVHSTDPQSRGPSLHRQPRPTIKPPSPLPSHGGILTPATPRRPPSDNRHRAPPTQLHNPPRRASVPRPRERAPGAQPRPLDCLARGVYIRHSIAVRRRHIRPLAPYATRVRV